MPADIPTTLLAELTHRCPLHCPYCSNPLDLIRAESELATDDWKRVFTQARELGVLQLGLSGGEPLLRKDLEELAAHARRLGLYSTLVTSGLGLTRARAERLKDAGLEHIQISIQDSDPETAERIAGRALGQAQAGRRRHRPGARLRLYHQRGAPPGQPRPHRRDHRSGRRSRGRPARARQHPVLRLGAPEPGGAHADAGTGATRRGRSPSEPFSATAAGCRSPTCSLTTTSSTRRRATAGGASSISWSRPTAWRCPATARTQITTLDFDDVRSHSLEWIWQESDAFQAFRGDAG